MPFLDILFNNDDNRYYISKITGIWELIRRKQIRRQNDSMSEAVRRVAQKDLKNYFSELICENRGLCYDNKELYQM